MSDDIIEKTKTTGSLYFSGIDGEKPFELWRAFDKDLGKELSLFITGKLYAREKIPHPTRQLVTVAVLTVLSRPEELKLHIQAALNVGCTSQGYRRGDFPDLYLWRHPYGKHRIKGAQGGIDRKGPMACRRRMN